MTFAFPHQTQLLGIKPISPFYLILEFKRPHGFDFKAGQHVTLQLKDDEGTFQRTYSIASPPSVKSHLEFCIQTQDDLRSFAQFESLLSKGTLVKMTSARGEFQIQETEKALIFIAGGSGISPLKSMIQEYLKNHANPAQIRLLYGCKVNTAIPFLKELNLLCEKSKSEGKDFQIQVYAEMVEPNSESSSTPSFPIAVGRVTLGLELNPRLIAPLNHYYLCGPAAMVRAIEWLLLERGVTSDFIHFERYG